MSECNIRLQGYTGKGYTQNPNGLLYDYRVSDKAQRLYGVLLDAQFRGRFVTQEYLTKQLRDKDGEAVSVRTIITRKGGHLGSVGYNFENAGLFDFNYSGTEESLEEALVLGDVDVKEISLEDGVAEVVVSPSDFEKAKEILKDIGVNDFEVSQITKIANETVKLEGEELTKFKELLSLLDECEDVQAVYHNVDL